MHICTHQTNNIWKPRRSKADSLKCTYSFKEELISILNASRDGHNKRCNIKKLSEIGRADGNKDDVAGAYTSYGSGMECLTGVLLA